jgi:hypothetical protein
MVLRALETALRGLRSLARHCVDPVKLDGNRVADMRQIDISLRPSQTRVVLSRSKCREMAAFRSSGLTKMTSLGLRRGQRPRRVGSAEPSPPSGRACLLGLFGL